MLFRSLEGQFSEFMQAGQNMDEIYQALTDHMLDNNAKLSNQLQINMRNEIDKNNSVIRKWVDEQQANQEPIINVTLLKHEIQSAVEKNITSQIAESVEPDKVRRLEEEVKELKLQNETQRQYAQKQADSLEQLQATLEQLRAGMQAGQQPSTPSAAGAGTGGQTLTAMQLHTAAKKEQAGNVQTQAGSATHLSAGAASTQAGSLTRTGAGSVTHLSASVVNAQVSSTTQTSAGAASMQAGGSEARTGAAMQAGGSVSQTSTGAAENRQAGAGQQQAPETNASAQQPVETVFTMDAAQNKDVLRKIIAQCDLLKESLETKIGRGNATEAYFKLVAKCQEKFTELLSLTEEKEFSSAKLASQTAKILKHTIIRALPQKLVSHLMEQFLQTCGVRKIEWEQGHKISGQDAYYMDETMISYQETKDIRLDQCILHIDQDAYAIDFADDSEVYEAIIPGIYKVGKYVK